MFGLIVFMNRKAALIDLRRVDIEAVAAFEV